MEMLERDYRWNADVIGGGKGDFWNGGDDENEKNCSSSSSFVDGEKSGSIPSAVNNDESTEEGNKEC
jgi:hypothetical protein